MVFSGLLRRVALVRTDVSEEPGASFIRVTIFYITRMLFIVYLCRAEAFRRSRLKVHYRAHKST
jgi:hypothetical protein